jgi:hypothetical protein
MAQGYSLAVLLRDGVYVRVHTTCTKACALHSLLLALRTALRAIDAPSKFLRAAAPFAYA